MPHPHLLLIAADRALAHVVRALLLHGRMICTVIPDALASDIKKFAVILVDLDPPLHTTRSILIDIRSRYDGPLILLVSDRVSEQDKISAFDAGADDVIEKPFFPREFLARIRALLRRKSFVEAAIVASDYSPKAPVTPPLNEKQAKLLRLLEGAPGRTFTHGKIMEAVWDDPRHCGVDNLRMLVFALRRKLEEHGSPLRIISSRGVGYAVVTSGGDLDQR